MITLAEISVEEILPQLGTNKPRIAIDVNGQIFKVKAESTRYLCFANSLKCCNCEITGNVFLLQQTYKRESPHLNLFHKNGNLYILMTQDHKIPKSRGGSNSIYNLRTMCFPCNMEKADKVID